jgi:hypothetical protein
LTPHPGAGGGSAEAAARTGAFANIGQRFPITFAFFFIFIQAAWNGVNDTERIVGKPFGSTATFAQRDLVRALALGFAATCAGPSSMDSRRPPRVNAA